MVLLVLKLAMLFLVLRSQMTTSPEEEAVARICWNLRFHDRHDTSWDPCGLLGAGAKDRASLGSSTLQIKICSRKYGGGTPAVSTKVSLPYLPPSPPFF